MRSVGKGLLAALLLVVLLGAAGPVLMSVDPKGVAPTLVALLPWAAFVALLGTSRVARQPLEQALVGLGGGALGAAALSILSLAVAAERQNYWDAWHFSSTFWAGALASLFGATLLVRARRDSRLASSLVVVACALVFVFFAIWAWMTFSFVQDIEGAVARWAWHLTHG